MFDNKRMLTYNYWSYFPVSEGQWRKGGIVPPSWHLGIPWYGVHGTMVAIKKFYFNQTNVDTQLNRQILGFVQFNTELQSFIWKFITNLNQLL